MTGPFPNQSWSDGLVFEVRVEGNRRFASPPPAANAAYHAARCRAAGGAGYAFWLGRRFNLALNLDWSRAAFGGDKFKGAGFWRFSLGFGWY